MDRSPDPAIVTPRRRFLAATIPAAGAVLPGCSVSENGTSGGDPDSTGTAPAGTPTATPGIAEMHEGSPLVEVTVDTGFSGTVRLEGDCRNDTVEVPPGETASFTRDSDGEECSVSLVIDSETRYETHVLGYQSYFLTVDADGGIDEEVVVV